MKIRYDTISGKVLEWGQKPRDPGKGEATLEAPAGAVIHGDSKVERGVLTPTPEQSAERAVQARKEGLIEQELKELGEARLIEKQVLTVDGEVVK